MRWRVVTAALVFAGVAGCSSPLTVESFGTAGPSFDPIRFWTGHVSSWGVVENRSGEPSDTIVTDCVGEPDGADGLHMVQHLTRGDGNVQVREWHLRRSGPMQYEATANDMVGTAKGTSAGSAFHWSWVLATKPGNALANVTMDQWMYSMDGGTMVNRTTISKFGITLAEVTEQFSPAR